MYYYIEKNKKIVLFDENKQKLIDSLVFMPQYKDLEIQWTNDNIIQYKGEYVFEDDIQDQLVKDRREKFNQEFFNTSLGYVRRKVTMADGSHKDFLTDLLPTISMAVNANQEVKILTYDKPPFTEDVIDWTKYQHKVDVTLQFIQECFKQVSDDFFG